jgi:hypothetical protein
MPSFSMVQVNPDWHADVNTWFELENLDGTFGSVSEGWHLARLDLIEFHSRRLTVPVGIDSILVG